MKNDKVNGLFLRPFPWVKSSSELYDYLATPKPKKLWYDVEVNYESKEK